MSKILVIKHGALGDIVQATASFAAIRQHHAHDHIVLMTTRPYAKLLESSGYFNEVWIDSRPKIFNVPAFLGVVSRIRNGGFARVYDLQTSDRTSWYFRLMGGKAPEWSGIVPGSSHRHNTPERTSLHTVDREKQQLEIAGIQNSPAPSLDWLTADISQFKLPEKYFLVAAGGSAHRCGKRWPAIHFGEVCKWANEKGYTPVLLGTQAEASVLSTIESLCPDAINLLGKTGFAEIATLARTAAFAVGNDTGPMHLTATAGCPSLVLFSEFSNPALCAPRGKDVTIQRAARLADLKPKTVIEWIGKRIQK